MEWARYCILTTLPPSAMHVMRVCVDVVTVISLLPLRRLHSSLLPLFEIERFYLIILSITYFSAFYTASILLYAQKWGNSKKVETVARGTISLHNAQDVSILFYLEFCCSSFCVGAFCFRVMSVDVLHHIPRFHELYATELYIQTCAHPSQLRGWLSHLFLGTCT